jgi:hypothetical protein
MSGRGQRKTFLVEGTFSVKDFVEKMGRMDRHELQANLKSSNLAKKWAVADTRRQITESLKTSRFPSCLKVRFVKFVETDSSNGGHATAYFDVFYGPRPIIVVLEKVFNLRR